MHVLNFFYKNVTQNSFSLKNCSLVRHLHIYQQGSCDEVIASVLSESNRTKTIQRAEESKKIFKPRIKLPQRAAVLVALCHYQNEPCMILNIRSSKLINHKGQVSFPGGAVDSADKSLVETALRETEEEIGLPKDQVDVWMSMNPIPERNLTTAVLPVVGYAGHVDPSCFYLNKDEVEELLIVPIHFLVDLKNWKYTKFRFNNRKAAARDYTTPVILTKPVVWGMTSVMIDMVLRVLIPERYEGFAYGRRKIINVHT